MKVFLYKGLIQKMSSSGIYTSYLNQRKMLDMLGIEIIDDEKKISEADIVHINTVIGNSYKILKKAHKLNIPVVVHGHSTKEDFLNSFKGANFLKIFFNKSLTNMYKEADAIITPTNYSKQLILNYNLNNNIFSISNGIDINSYTNILIENDEFDNFLKTLKLNKNEKYFISMGHYFIRKGIDTFFKVASFYPDIKFIWLGKLTNISMSKDVKNILKLKPNNVILPGFVSGDIKKLLIKNSLAYLCFSKEETEGITVIEALSLKIPLIVNDIGCFKDWLIHDYNCFKGSSLIEFKNLIDNILNKNYNYSLIENGFNTAKERDFSIIKDKLYNVYKNTIKNYK